MLIAALLFDDLSPLDIVGPLEVLARAPGAEIVLAGRQRAVQLSIEYDPQPPFDAGSPAKAGPALVSAVRAATARARRR